MILIQKATTNLVILTLSERTTITDAYYLFTFTNSTTKEIKSFIGLENSVNPFRANEFSIEENDVEDLEESIVSLSTGFWTYSIREQESSTNLVVAESGNVVEIGKVLVYENEAEIPTFTEEITTIKSFNG
jgi:hypothetical protein